MAVKIGFPGFVRQIDYEDDDDDDYEGEPRDTRSVRVCVKSTFPVMINTQMTKMTAPRQRTRRAQVFQVAQKLKQTHYP